MKAQKEIRQLAINLKSFYDSINRIDALIEIGSNTPRTIQAEKLIKDGQSLLSQALSESSIANSMLTLNSLSKVDLALNQALKIIMMAKQDLASEKYANQLSDKLIICLDAISKIQDIDLVNEDTNLHSSSGLLLKNENEFGSSPPSIASLGPITLPDTIRNKKDEENQFVDQLRSSFNLQEIKQICFKLNVPFEDLEGTGVTDKARELYLFVNRRGDLARLVELVKKERPNTNWKLG